ncbi:hypothetical protein, partial [Actinoplanes philippinensis]|uniref:hypothetical protein n=1 Tax=Actinoplanes philippinensis TaxID=35752 RepID=UPI0033CF71F2
MTGWARDMSGWRPEFGAAEESIPARWEVLAELIGRPVVGWTIGDPDRRRWFGVGPLVLVADGGAQVEIGWRKWNDLSITGGTVDLTVPPVVAGRVCAWRPSEPPPVAAVAGRVITGFAAVEEPYFDGEVDLGGALPMDRVAGWMVDGLWIEFGETGLNVHNGAGENGYSSAVPETSRIR